MNILPPDDPAPWESQPEPAPFFVLAFLDGPMKGQLQFERESPMERTWIVEPPVDPPKRTIPTYSPAGQLKPAIVDASGVALRRAEYFPLAFTKALEIPGTDRMWEVSLWKCEADRHLFLEADAEKAFDRVNRAVLRIAGPALAEAQRKARRARRRT